jgi:hypothetical protein
VDSAGVLPMRNQDAHGPLSPHANAEATVDGARLGAAGGAGQHFRAGRAGGDAVDLGRGVRPLRPVRRCARESSRERHRLRHRHAPPHFTLAQAVGGGSYYSASASPRPPAKLNLAFSADLPKAAAQLAARPDAKPINSFLALNPFRADPSPDGLYHKRPLLGNPKPVAFWVGRGGLATFHAAMAKTPLTYSPCTAASRRTPRKSPTAILSCG